MPALGECARSFRLGKSRIYMQRHILYTVVVVDNDLFDKSRPPSGRSGHDIYKFRNKNIPLGPHLVVD